MLSLSLFSSPCEKLNIALPGTKISFTAQKQNIKRETE